MFLHALENYRPIAALLLGLAGWLSALGVGINLLELLRIRLTSPLKQVTGLLLGLLSLSLVVQILGMTGFSTKNNLIFTGIIFGAVGAYGILRKPIRLFPSKPGLQGWFDFVLIGFISVALLTNLLVAMAPSTKIDELYYHMLLPARILNDGGLVFYRLPWESAIYPQMLFQIASTIFYAFGFADAPNVLSWCISLTLTWFVWYIIFENTSSPKTGARESPENERARAGASIALVCAASVVIGMYAVVWHVTGGAHAFGDLALAPLIVLLYFQKKLADQWGARAVILTGGIFGVAAAASKVSILPLVLLCSIILIYLQWRNNRKNNPFKLGLLLLSPWIILYFPIVIWTLIKSGSPFGPILAGISNWSIYQGSGIQASLAEASSITRQINFGVLTIILTYSSPILWAAILYGLFFPWPDKMSKLIFMGLLFFQSAIIIFILPLDLRFLGGLQYGILCILGLPFLLKVQSLTFLRSRFILVTIILLLPWLVLQVYYAIPFEKVVLGFTSPAIWCEQYIPLCSDFKKLDRILPSDAQLLANPRLASIYSPRPVYYDINDINLARPIFAFYIGDPDSYSIDIGSCTRGGLTYFNSQAKFQTYRTPGTAPDIEAISVFQINCVRR